MEYFIENAVISLVDHKAIQMKGGIIGFLYGFSKDNLHFYLQIISFV